MNKRYLIGRHAHVHKLTLDIVIKVKSFLWRALIQKNELSELLIFAPNGIHVPDAVIELRTRLIGSVRVNEAHIERSFAAIGRNLEHVILCSGYLPGLDLLSPVCQLANIVAQSLA